MSVAILIEFKDPTREALYLPVATQGTYSSDWVPVAQKLGLNWLPLFLTGMSVRVEELAVIADEFRSLRTVLADDPGKASTVERLDFILERLRTVNGSEVAEIFIG